MLETVRNLAARGIMALDGAVRGRPSAGLEHLAEIRQFLILHYAEALGVAVHASVLVEALRKAVPDASIVVASSGLALEVVRHDPYADRTIATPPPQERLLAAARTIRREWRPAGSSARCIVTGTGSVKSSIAVLSLLAGKAVRVGHTLVPLLYHRPVDNDPRRSVLDNNLRVLEELGYPYRHYEPRVFFSEEDLAAARDLLFPNAPGESRPTAIFVTQASGYQPKSWPSERFAAVADHLFRRLGARVVFVGASDQADGIEKIRSLMKGESVSLAGRTSVAVLAALLCLADIAVTLDTGTMHIGRAATLPMVVIAPAWDPGINWLPFGHDQIEVLKGDDIPVAPVGYMMEEITVEQVERSLERLLEKYPPLLAARQTRTELCLSRTGQCGRKPVGQQ